MDIRDDRARWVGIDVGADHSTTCIINQDGQVIGQQEVRNSAACIADFIDAVANGNVALIGVEASSLSPHLVRGLRALNFPVAIFDSRQARKYLRIRQNKTDRNDARGLAEIALHGRNIVSEVRLKSLECQKVRSQLAMRQHLVRHRVATEGAIRAVLRLNGGSLKKCTSARTLRRNTLEALEGVRNTEGLDLSDTVMPVLIFCEQLRKHLVDVDKALAAVAHEQEVCRRFMEISGIGPISSLSFYSAVEEPTRFKRNEDIGPFLGMVPRVEQSGATVRRFGISRMGNKMTRQHLVTAASIYMRSAPKDAAVRRWGEQLRERLPAQKVRIAVARKLAIIMLAMWKNQTQYRPEGNLESS